MTSAEKLLELVSYAEDAGTEWYSEIPDGERPETIISKAKKSKPTPDTISFMVFLLGEDPYELPPTIKTWKYCLELLEDRLTNEN